MPISRQQALDHFHSPDLIGLGFEADAVRRRLHPEGVVTYIIDRNINYTNVCNVVCTFCAFYRRPGAPDTYVRTLEEICEKIDETMLMNVHEQIDDMMLMMLTFVEKIGDVMMTMEDVNEVLNVLNEMVDNKNEMLNVLNKMMNDETEMYLIHNVNHECEMNNLIWT